MNNTSVVGLVILAAGASTRLGKPKQQLQYQGQSLLQHALTTAQEAAIEPIVVVLGANAASIQNTSNFGIAHVIENPNWAEGMASSIRMGLNHLLELTPDLSAVIIMVCDQPFVSANLINQLLNTQTQACKGIVASSYQDTLGTPVLFSQKYFQDLRSLQGQEGAKKLLQKYAEDVAPVLFPKGNIDIDTQQDYENLQKNYSE